MLDTTDFLFSQEGLVFPVKRCRPKNNLPRSSEAEFVLLFVHGIGTHKETWLPTIEHLFELQSRRDGVRTGVIEAWIVEVGNHGEAAVVNEAILLERPGSLADHQTSRMILRLLRSDLLNGKKTIIVGHSGGACVGTFATLGCSLQDLPIHAMIVVEPAMITREFYTVLQSQETSLVKTLVEMAKTRKDVWPSRAAARKWLSKRPPWQRWDPRVLDRFVSHGFRDLPTATYPDLKEGVTLCCTRAQEALWYSLQEDGVNALERLSELSTVIPVHCVFGSIPDVTSKWMKQDIVDSCKGASVTVVKGAGHFVPQEDPENLASALWTVLHSQRGHVTKVKL
ncbi:alpha/beta-hydrolase [Artomyces pyxidatus]|uniref:Alpha/beta-hydrolase n=1 Tax=Artomyces pyxidatus TaxID=48021 RepID=A0ACB8T7B9_9AGAM|nr:alpha/beta-hydrolase [Artomyces pyxidatus]